MNHALNTNGPDSPPYACCGTARVTYRTAEVDAMAAVDRMLAACREGKAPLSSLNAVYPCCEGEHTKTRTFRQPATPEAIRDLCGKHIASLQDMLRTQQLSTTPHCLWEEPCGAGSGGGQPPLRFGGSHNANLSHTIGNRTVSGKPLTVRECLEHDHRCRSATALYDLATTCHRMADELSRTHRREMAEMRRQLASVKRCVVEWEATFGGNYSVSPATVGAELRSLRMQVADLRRENGALKAQGSAMRVQHDALACYYDPMLTTGPAGLLSHHHQQHHRHGGAPETLSARSDSALSAASGLRRRASSSGAKLSTSTKGAASTSRLAAPRSMLKGK